MKHQYRPYAVYHLWVTIVNWWQWCGIRKWEEMRF